MVSIKTFDNFKSSVRKIKYYTSKFNDFPPTCQNAILKIPPFGNVKIREGRDSLNSVLKSAVFEVNLAV